MGAAARDRVVESAEYLQRGIHDRRQVPLARLHEHVATHHLVVGHADEVQRTPAARRQFVALGVVVLKCPDPDLHPPGMQFQLVVDAQVATGEGACHHRAGALRGECPVHPQSRPAVVLGGWCRCQHFVDGGPEVVQPDTARRVYADDGCAVEERAGHLLLDLEAGQLDQVGVGRPDLRQGDEAVSHAQQFQNPQVLLGLRLPALGGGHHEQACIDRAHSGQHVLDEPDVSGHVDQRQRRT